MSNFNHHEISRASNTHYRPDVDGLRALAVFGVVLFHINNRLLPGGFSGVDVFFVISGYVISRILANELNSNTFSILAFYKRRVIRLLPALLLVLVCVWLAGWLILLPNDFSLLGKHIVTSSAFIENIAYWFETGYFDAEPINKPLLHLWSLGVEEQFYLIWPGLLVMAWRLPKHLLGLGLVLAAFSFIANLIGIHFFPDATFYLLHGRLWEFIVGGTIAILEIKRKLAFDIKIRQIFSIVGLMLVLYGMFFISTNVSYPGFQALFPTLGAALILLAGYDVALNSILLSSKPAVWSGLISYPIYLWHWPLLWLSAQFVAKGYGVTICLTLVIILTIVLSIATYFLVESPFRNKNKLWAKVPVLLTMLFMTCILGMFTWQTGGFPSRFPTVVQKISNYHFDYQTAYRYGSCFIDAHKTADLDKTCDDATIKSQNKPIVMLIGDSHAAHLYPGLAMLSTKMGFAIAQITAGGCVPIEGLSGETTQYCSKLRSEAVSSIGKLHPDFIVFSARWEKYGLEKSLQMAKEALINLRAQGGQNIIIVGPVPNWSPSLPNMLLDRYKHSLTHLLPARIEPSPENNLHELDMALRMSVENAGGKYLSALDQLCNTAGCLAITPGKSGDLTAWDYGHLTTSGSIVVMNGVAVSIKNFSHSNE